MTAENVTPLKNEVAAAKTFSLTPSNLEEAMKFSEMIANSDIVPKDFKGKAGNVLIAVQMGAELGLPPMQAIQNIAVINGRPSIWGDSLPALAKGHPKYEYMNESFDDSTMTAICEIKRKGEPVQTFKFSQDDAQTAGLWGKQGPWQNYPKRMLKMRARAFAIRDVFPDALKGLNIAEEVQDIPEKDMGEAHVVDNSTPAQETEAEVLPQYPDERFKKKLNRFAQQIQNGEKTADDIISMISTTYTLSDDQKKQLREITAR